MISTAERSLLLLLGSSVGNFYGSHHLNFSWDFQRTDVWDKLFRTQSSNDWPDMVRGIVSHSVALMRRNCAACYDYNKIIRKYIYASLNELRCVCVWKGCLCVWVLFYLQNLFSVCACICLPEGVFVYSLFNLLRVSVWGLRPTVNRTSHGFQIGRFFLVFPSRLLRTVCVVYSKDFPCLTLRPFL